MKSRIVFGGLLTAIIGLSSILSMPMAMATPLEPDWFNGDPILRKSARTYSTEQCTHEMRQVALNASYYYKEEDKHPKDWCIYHYKSFDITFYKRWFSNVVLDMSDTLGLYLREESGMAISFNHGNLVPVDNIGFSLKDSLVYVPNSEGPLVRTGCEYIGCQLAFYNFRQHIEREPASASQTYVYSAPNGEQYIKYDSGEPVRADGIASSENGAWISFIIPYIGLARLNMETSDWDIVDTGYTYVPDYSLTSITNDGKLVVRLGSTGEQRAVKYTQGCAIRLPSRLDVSGAYRTGLSTTCTERVISIPFLKLEQSVPGYVPVNYFSLAGDGSRAVLRESVHDSWYELYPYNAPVDSGMTYLALGDSFTSGEGDVIRNDISHYLPGTNMLGNHEAGIPRELCHVSDRSYPFLLAKDMGIARGNDMQSIACSGAVRNDIYSSNQSSPYYGQPVLQFDGATRPRLQGLSDIAALQESALHNFIPGRVRQIEMLKTYKPQVATIGISGNDLGFAGILVECMLNLPADEACDYAQGDGIKSLGSAIQSNYQKQVGLYKALKEASPGTDLYAVGYPQFINGDAVFCWEVGNLLTQKERSMIHYAVSFANQTIKNAAAVAGIKYINIEDTISSMDGDMCADGGMTTGPIDKLFSDSITKVVNRYEDGYADSEGYPIDISFIQNLKNTSRNLDEGVYVNALALVMQEASHPNARAHQAIYGYIHEHQTGSSLLDDQCDGAVIICPLISNAVMPRIPEYFGTTDTHTEFTNFVRVNDGTGQNYTEEDGLTTARRGDLVQVVASDSLFNPGDTANVVIRSEPRILRNVAVGESGKFDAMVTIPADLPVGYHLISVDGKSPTGQNVTYMQTIFVIGPKGDIDGDGNADSTDKCQFVKPSGVDMDDDNIDDGCDLALANSNINRALVSAVDKNTAAVDIDTNYQKPGELSGALQRQILGDNSVLSSPISNGVTIIDEEGGGRPMLIIVMTGAALFVLVCYLILRTRCQ